MAYNKNFEYPGRDLEAMSRAGNYHQWILSEFKPYLGKHIAEIGAGTGNFSVLLLGGSDRRLTAFEPSANMYPLLRERLSGAPAETVNGYLGEEYAKYEREFDAVLYVNVLEHVENDREELRYAGRILKAGGHLLVFVPALAFLYSQMDRELGHRRRYRKPALVKLVESAGFTVVKARYFDLIGVIAWYLAFVWLKRSMSGAKAFWYDKLIVPVMSRVERIWAPPFGKNILLVARKNDID